MSFLVTSVSTFVIALEAFTLSYFHLEKQIGLKLEFKFGKEFASSTRRYLPFCLSIVWISSVATCVWLCFATTSYERIWMAFVTAASLYSLNFGANSGVRMVSVLLLYIFKAGILLKSHLGVNRRSHFFGLKFRNAVFIFSIVSSFSFRTFLNDGNWKFFGLAILGLMISYISLVLWDSITTQKNLIEFAETIEKAHRSLKRFDAAKIRDPAHPIPAMIRLAVLILKNNNPKDFVIPLAGERKYLQRFYFWSLYLVALVRTYLLGRVISAFLFLALFVVIVEGNYLEAVSYFFNKEVSVNDLAYFSTAFFRYTVNETTLPQGTGAPAFIEGQTLMVSVIGWLVFVILIVLVVDVFSSSYSQLYSALVELSRKLRGDIESVFEFMENQSVGEPTTAFLFGLFGLIEMLQTNPEEKKRISELTKQIKNLLEKSLKAKKDAVPAPGN